MPASRRGSTASRLVIALVVLAAVLGGAVALAVLRYAPYLDDLRELRGTAERVSTQVRTLGVSDVDRATVAGLRADLAELDVRLEPFRTLVMDDPIVDLVGLAPVAGEQVAAARALVAAADDLVAAGDLGMGLADEYVELRERQAQDPGISLTGGLVRIMATSTDEVDELASRVESARARLAAIPDSAIAQIRSVRDLVREPLDRYAPVLAEYRRLDDVLPGIMGSGEERRYLVLAQNPAELRPAGGYVGTVGIITLRDGQLVERTFRDVYDYDLQKDNPYIDPPPAIRDHLVGDEGWRLADAAWSPHFPTSAQDAIRLYTSESGDSDIDGVIGITTYALDRILEVIGPVTVPGFDVTVAPGDVTITILGATRGTAESIEGRKAILDVLAETVLTRLLALPPEQVVPLAAAAEDIGRRRLALAWFADPAAQAYISGRTWAGEVRQDAGDYLYAVDSNVAPTSKYNLVVHRSSTLEVALDPDGEARHALRLDWRNDAGKRGEPYESIRSFSTNTEGLYATYTRVLAPADSQLESASGQGLAEVGGPERVEEEAGRAVFANYLMIPPGAAHLAYEWTTREGGAAEDDGAWRYRLTVQKQPGHGPESLRLLVRLPAGAQVTDATPGLAFEGGSGTLTTTLVEDLEVEVGYRLAGPPGEERP